MEETAPVVHPIIFAFINDEYPGEFVQVSVPVGIFGKSHGH
jgi:hypothetical protein